MTATNGTGYEIQIHIDQRIGWITESKGYSSLEEAQKMVDVLPKNDFERRAYESLEGY